MIYYFYVRKAIHMGWEETGHQKFERISDLTTEYLYFSLRDACWIYSLIDNDVLVKTLKFKTINSALTEI